MHVVFGSRVEYVEEPLHIIADLQHTRQITAAVTVVRGTPHRAQPVVKENLITFVT